MTFAETQALINEIEDIATWSRHMATEIAKDTTNWDEYNKMEKWLEEAKQTIFDRCTK